MNCPLTHENQDVKHILTSFHFCDIFPLKYSSQQESTFMFKSKIPVFRKKKKVPQFVISTIFDKRNALFQILVLISSLTK